MAELTVEQPKMPSADLINYRFDNIEKIQKSTNDKLDMLTNNFLTREEAQTLTQERDAKIADIQRQLDADRAERRWKTRMIATAAYSALFVSVGTFIVYALLRIKP